MKTLKLTFFIILSLAFISLQAQIIHVPVDHPTIQEGIDAAQFFGDTVLVADGEYVENINFDGKLITVASNYILDGDTNHINNTIIDGSNPSNPEEGSVVTFRNNEDSTTVLCGFTITGGTGTLVPADDIRTGGGILIENSNPKIIHNHIIDNHISTNLKASGGGISVGDPTDNDGLTIIQYNRISYNTVEGYAFAEGGGLSLYSNGLIEHNVITHNEISSESEHVVGGGVRCYGVLEPRYIQFIDNIISHNEAFAGSMETYGGAGGMQAYNCWGYISNNLIQFNKIYGDIGSLAGGLHFGYCGTFMILENNFIADNSANHGELGGIGGGVVLYSSNIQFINNVIVRNYAEIGSGVQNHFNLDGPTQFINNTIAYNEGDGEGGAIYLNEADAVVLNSILWENGSSGNEIYLEDAEVEVAYSNILGGWPGLGNIDDDPDFEDDSCHLNCSGPSPCIDAGLGEFNFGSVYSYAPDKDFEGEERPLDVTFDIGADESLICTGVDEILRSQDTQMDVYPNPCSGDVHLRYSILDTRYLILELLSPNGNKLRTLFSGKQLAGEHEHDFDLYELPNGIYYIRLQADGQTETSKIIILK